MRWPRVVSPGVLVVLAASVLAPLLAASLRGTPGPRCGLDGVALENAPVVQLGARSGEQRAFCCVGCAQRWIVATDTIPACVTVTDADDGSTLDARDAWFVRSTVLAQPATRDRVHAFASEHAARRHAETFRGRILEGAARPFDATH